MTETISKHIGEGFGKGELYAALSYDTGDAFGGMRVKSMYFSKTLAATTERALQIATTNALTSGTVRSVQIDQVHTGDGAVAEALTVTVTSDVKTGSWVNAIFGRTNYTEDGWAYGSASAICGELSLPPGGSHSGQGTYSVFQAELDVPASAIGIGSECSIFTINVWGDQKALFDTGGFLFSISGITTNNSGFWKDGTMSAQDAQETIKVKTPGGIRYIALYDSR